jgi:ubiquinone/menaquinone biosynthesis C-methylase UbiE
MFTKSIVYDSKNRPLGYIVTDKPKNEKFLAEYERKKDKFIDEVRKKRASGRHEYLEERARKLIENEEFVRLFREAKTKRLKKLHTIYFLQGELLSIEELNMLVDYIEYFLLKDLENKREKLHKVLSKKV